MLPREQLLDGLLQDLIGPQAGDEEVIEANPSDQYVAGILYHKPVEPEAEDDAGEETAEADDGSPGEAISMSAMGRPNMMGISFALKGKAPRVRVTATCGRYVREGAAWRRTPILLEAVLPVSQQLTLHQGEGREGGLCWWVRGLPPLEGDVWQVSVVLTNEASPEPGRENREAALVFQASFEVRAGEGCQFEPRLSRQALTDEDALSSAVVYRNAREWAVGHTCSATWHDEGGEKVLEATWVPVQHVPAMSATGDDVFRRHSARIAQSETAAFSAERLSTAPSAEALCSLLHVVPDAYGEWLDGEELRLPHVVAKEMLGGDLEARAWEHIAVGRRVVLRMRRGIELLRVDETARRAFQLSQQAMVLQRLWGEEDPTKQAMVWRPFQLGFLLLTLESIAAPVVNGEVTSDRETMDLLWFPTGGGKTEAYLGLTAFTLFHRRLREGVAPDNGAGVAILMRYTLRLLTVQQFERAARLIVACDYLRRNVAGALVALGDKPFGIGLWVGSAATPNNLRDLTPEEEGRIRQLARCPACRQNTLNWKIRPAYSVTCAGQSCPVRGLALPIWTVDSEVYANRPSLVIGTVDKFAQVVRKQEARSLLRNPPPELIIQDELHLISGPLGTMVGLYEAAIDQICSRGGVPPKIVGSTATIRRAADQVLRLFDRQVLQFPPPILDAENSCFAVVDDGAPGRLYAGVTTSGRSPKFMLQAVCASLMQWAHELDISDEQRDPYWTLVSYFNSLRELGGALVMMQDDVDDSIQMYADLHGSKSGRRPTEEPPLELTSRVDSSEIPRFLVELEQRFPNQPFGSVLATNMISVGVDIPRLGLMVVNGQPKGMAEYIQATSRVGRGNVAGLVVTVYNAGRPRDRSHFEAFRTWHQTLYREVEAMSVTPFAPRARDRALHAVVVAVARHLLPELADDPPALDAGKRARVDGLVNELLARVGSVDPDEVSGVAADAARFLDYWQQRDDAKYYWHGFKPQESLLASLEQVATANALGGWRHKARGTPNSMRNVEPETHFKIWEAPMSRRGGYEQE